MSDKQSAFQLSWNTSEENDKCVFNLVEFDDHEYTRGWVHTNFINVPENIFFKTDILFYENIDFPFNDVQWPLMTKYMIDVLFSITPFKHRLIPVTILDHENKIISENDYYSLQLIEHLDILDMEKSVYIMDDEEPERIIDIFKAVFKETVFKLPPVFRLKVNPLYLFVSYDAKHALERAGVKGLEFRELDGII